jgi:hypothetical protein
MPDLAVSSLQGNIEMHFYTSGHMVYAHEPDLKSLHANVAAFIEKTRNGSVKCSLGWGRAASWYAICFRSVRRFQTGAGDV